MSGGVRELRLARYSKRVSYNLTSFPRGKIKVFKIIVIGIFFTMALASLMPKLLMLKLIPILLR